MSSKVLITGATGFIGSELTTEMARLGAEVVVITRSAQQVSALRSVGFSANTYENIDQYLPSVEVVLHLATRNNDVAGTEQEFLNDNLELTKWLGNKAREAGVKRLVYVTSTKALNPSAKDFYGISKARAEQALMSLETKEFSVVRVRLPAVYGKKSKGKIKILDSVPTVFRPVMFELLRALVPIVSIDRVVNCLVQLSNSSASCNPEVCVTDPVNQNVFYRMFQIVLNVMFVVFVCTFLIIPSLIVGLAIALTSQGEVIYKQTRIGLNKAPFRFMKFRTMEKGAPVLATHEAGTNHLTGVGGVLRKYKLDEIPQAFNVLSRQMDVVGPRPCLESQVELIRQRELYGIFTVRPGITGLAQVSGLNMSEPGKLSLADYQYLSFRSMVWDFKIILKTATGLGFGDPLVQSGK